jgi:hypothetical protein
MKEYLKRDITKVLMMIMMIMIVLSAGADPRRGLGGASFLA